MLDEFDGCHVASYPAKHRSGPPWHTFIDLFWRYAPRAKVLDEFEHRNSLWQSRIYLAINCQVDFGVIHTLTFVICFSAFALPMMIRSWAAIAKQYLAIRNVTGSLLPSTPSHSHDIPTAPPVLFRPTALVVLVGLHVRGLHNALTANSVHSSMPIHP